MSNLNPEKIYNSLIESGESWADLQAAAELLEESKKSVLAELANKCPENSLGARESLALADPVYRLHLVNMVAARQAATRARVRYDALKVLADMRRTIESSRRAEMKL